MARYTCNFLFLRQVSTLSAQILRSCNFNTIHEANDCLVIKEGTDQVLFSKLVCIEVFIDSTTAIRFICL